ncbi:MAG: dTDP-4-dehydrorhamnose 3,5-epimerase [Anaerolineales bacterium]
MEFAPTKIPDVLQITPRIFEDDRGFFFESFQACLFESQGIPLNFVQDNHVGSKRGVLRGMHYQIQHAQGKLVRVVVGKVFDVAVDLRRSSPTFGRWMGVSLSAEAKEELWIPPGFAHGYYTMSEWAEVLYKVTDFYAPEWERTLLWNDPQLEIEWPIPEGHTPILSDKDARGAPFRQTECYE